MNEENGVFHQALCFQKSTIKLLTVLQTGKFYVVER